MIKAILVFNNHGKPRLSKFYQYFTEYMQQQIIKETFQLVSKRDDNVCNFLEGGKTYIFTYFFNLILFKDTNPKALDYF